MTDRPGSLDRPDRVLAIGAHPDDIEFGCGATLARWSSGGSEVHLLILTDGSKGSWEVQEDLDTLIETRKREAQEAAGALGATAVHFLDAVDGELEGGLMLRGSVARVIRETTPDSVLGHDPWKRYRLHPDHRHAGFLTVDGLVAARDPHFFPRQGPPHHRPSTLLLFEADEPDHWEPAEPAHLDAKVRALLCHRSQWRSTMGVHADPVSERPAFEHKVFQDAAEAGHAAGLRHAEAFRRIELEER